MKDIPIIRAGRDDINMIFSVFACAQELERCERVMERRVRAIPNAWRDLRLCRSLLDKLASNLVMTVQPEKLPGMRRMVRHLKFKIICGPEASQLEQDECIVREDEINTLMVFAHEQCKLCDRDHCRGCELGKVFDTVLTYDRDGRSWASVDMKSMMHK